MASWTTFGETDTRPTFDISTKTTDYNMLSTDFIINGAPATAAIDIKLPEPSAGRSVFVKNTNGLYDVNVNAYDTDTMDGATTIALSATYAFVWLYSDATNWFKMSES